MLVYEITKIPPKFKFESYNNGRTTFYERMIANDGLLDDGMYDMLED